MSRDRVTLDYATPAPAAPHRPGCGSLVVTLLYIALVLAGAPLLVGGTLVAALVLVHGSDAPLAGRVVLIACCLAPGGSALGLAWLLNRQWPPKPRA